MLEKLTKGVGNMTKKHHFFQPIRDMHAVPYYILKLGLALITLYTAVLYMIVDAILPDQVYAYHIFQASTEYITISIVLLLVGSAWLHRLFKTYKKKSDT